MSEQDPSHKELLPVERFLWTLDIVHREGKHLQYSWSTLFERDPPIDAAWVAQLEEHPQEAVNLEAFVSRFGRMQDTIADKLLPRWLASLAESPQSQIENLNRAEQLGVIEDTEQWLQARRLRNLLVHEYMNDPNAFFEALQRAKPMAVMLQDTYANFRRHAQEHMNVPIEKLP